MAPGPSQQFQEFLAAGSFMLQRSRATGRYLFYPRAAAVGAPPDQLEWVPAGGGGVVYASTTIYPRKRPPYNVAIIELDEGPRLTSTVTGIDPEAVHIGMRVRAHIEPAQDTQAGNRRPRLVFRPASEDDRKD